MSVIAIAAPQSLHSGDKDQAFPVLNLDGPPPSLWSEERRERFLAALSGLASDDAARAIVLTGPNLFVAAAGEDVRAAPADLDGLLEAVSNCAKPVIAVLTQDAAGVGLELALACAARVAKPAVRLGLTGLRAARLPRPSTLWRLTQRAGVEATGMLLSCGTTVEPQAALAMGLIDALDENPLACARRIASAPIGVPPSRSLEAVEIEAALMGLRRRLRREAAGQTGPIAALKALEAVIRLPRRKVLADWPRMEADLARSAEGVALRYATAGALELGSTCDGDTIGTLSARLRWPFVREAVHLLDEGASPAQIDRCLEAFGFAVGPFTLSDQLGLDTVFAVPERGGWLTYSGTLDLMSEARRLGGESGLGWYRPFTEDSVIRFDPEVEHIVKTSAISQRLTRGSVADEAVVGRCLNAAVNASAALLAEHPALSPTTVDALWTTQLGFPSWKGGPLHLAAQTDIGDVLAALETQQARRPTTGPACALLRRWAAEGRLVDRDRPRGPRGLP